MQLSACVFVLSKQTGNVFDNVLDVMANWTAWMEQLVARRTEERAQETRRLEDLLNRMLPPAAATKIARGLPLAPESFDAVTIYFSGKLYYSFEYVLIEVQMQTNILYCTCGLTHAVFMCVRTRSAVDLVDFGSLTARCSSPLQIVQLLNETYTLFDAAIDHFDVYKVRPTRASASEFDSYETVELQLRSHTPTGRDDRRRVRRCERPPAPVSTVSLCPVPTRTSRTSELSASL